MPNTLSSQREEIELRDFAQELKETKGENLDKGEFTALLMQELYSREQITLLLNGDNIQFGNSDAVDSAIKTIVNDLYPEKTKHNKKPVEPLGASKVHYVNGGKVFTARGKAVRQDPEIPYKRGDRVNPADLIR